MLPAEASYSTMKLVKALQDKLLPAPGELEALPEYKHTSDGTVTWNVKDEEAKSFDFGGFEAKLIIEKLQTMDKEAKLTQAHLPLWEKFVEPGEDA